MKRCSVVRRLHWFQVIAADSVEAVKGTGLVPQSPAFGQEDYEAATAAGSPDRLPPGPVKGPFYFGSSRVRWSMSKKPNRPFYETWGSQGD